MISLAVGFIVGAMVGAVAGGFIVKNNQEKAYAVLEDLHAKAVAEYAKLLDQVKAEVKNHVSEKVDEVVNSVLSKKK